MYVFFLKKYIVPRPSIIIFVLFNSSPITLSLPCFFCFIFFLIRKIFIAITMELVAELFLEICVTDIVTIISNIFLKTMIPVVVYFSRQIFWCFNVDCHRSYRQGVFHSYTICFVLVILLTIVPPCSMNVLHWKFDGTHLFHSTLYTSYWS